MLEQLNLLEREIMIAIAVENSETYPVLVSLIPLLKVQKREFTGVGSFTYFQNEATESLPKNELLSSRKTLTIKGLENELSYVLALTDGKIDFLEIVTNGDDLWDGSPEGYDLT